MPSSTIERRSSGSMTARSFSVIWSSVGRASRPFSQRRVAHRPPSLARESVAARSALGASTCTSSEGGADVGDAGRASGGSWRSGSALALALLLLAAREARAGKYAVAQCGWHVGADADWADTTGGAKFRPDAYCAPPAGADPFDGAHLKSFTREGEATVSGTRFARWRWEAPPGTGITQVRGTWWHALHDGIEQRIGVGTAGTAASTPFACGRRAPTSTPRDFVAGFARRSRRFEDRLLCARAEGKWCASTPAPGRRCGR